MTTETFTPPESEGVTAGYAPGDDRPLAGYLVLSGSFVTALGAGLVAARRSGRPLERPSFADVVLAGLATQKLARLIAKDKITSFVRAPFTRFERRAGYGQVEETPRGDGIRFAVGELLVCPFCLAQWVSGGFAVGWAFAPGPTRLMSAMWATQSIADAAQLAYGTAQRRAAAG